MTTEIATLEAIDPFYAACLKLAGLQPQAGPQPRVVYAKLPMAPINSSPVPDLTSLYHNAEPGPFGDHRYPGNCSGNLIRDWPNAMSLVGRKEIMTVTGPGSKLAPEAVHPQALRPSEHRRASHRSQRRPKRNRSTGCRSFRGTGVHRGSSGPSSTRPEAT